MPADRLRFRDVRRTSAFRLTVVLGAVFATGVLILLGLVYGLTSRQLIARSDQILRAEAIHLHALSPADLPRRLTSEVANANGFNYLELISASGEKIVGNIAVSPGISKGRPIELHGGAAPLRLLAVRTASGETIIVARDISQVQSLRRRILVILAVSGVVILCGAAAAAVLLARQPLRRVRDLQLAARQIATGRFDIRMPIAGYHDELDQFAETANVMVEEIGRVIAQVRGVTDAIAHDLRTPLTRVRATLGRAAALAQGSPEHPALALRAIVDLDIVLGRFTALLRIAEIEAGARRSGFALVDLASLVAGVYALYEPLAEERGVAFRLDAQRDPTIEGDEQLLFEAISNLVDNAIKFTRTQVDMAIRTEGKDTVVEIADDGPGIPIQDRAAVLRRFHRGANAQAQPGSGLGLSVVAAIAHLHGHRLEFLDGQPGLIARLVMPRPPT